MHVPAWLSQLLVTYACAASGSSPERFEHASPLVAARAADTL